MRLTKFFGVIVSVLPMASFAYETPTHAFMTKAAFDRSDLAVNSAELYARLGFDRLDINQPFQTGFPDGCIGPATTFERDSAYVDARGNWLVGANVPPDTSNAFFRCPQIYERRNMRPEYSGRTRAPSATPPQPGPTPQLRFEAWLMRGVIREDDVAANYYTTPDRPDEDPWGEKTRVLNHFYSPVTNDKDYTGTPTEPSTGALPWALGEADPFAQNQLPDPTRGNHFSYMDARRAYFFALTYKQQPATANTAFTDSRVRMSLWSTTLKSLGHIVHLLQDQASPQHSRGEPHNHTCNSDEKLAFALNQDIATRTYENFINYRLTNDFNAQTPTDRYQATNDCEEAIWLRLFRQGDQAPPAPIAPWTTRVYPVPKFPLQRMFFTTRNPGDPTDPANVPVNTINARRGLGDYANRGFYTQDYQAGRYLSPPAANSPQFVESTPEILQIPGLGPLRVTNLSWAVPDPVQPGFADEGLDANGRVPIISQTVWCRLTAMGCNDLTMLSLRNYNQMADMLIPRAIAYSTGMINFFFRGKLIVDPIPQRVFAVMNQGDPHTMNADGYPIRTSNGQIFGFEKIRLRVRNSTDPITESGTNNVVPQVVGTGKLVAVARYHRNPCYKPDLTGERVLDFNNTLTEPNCPQGMRTNYQEISVSAPLTITGNASLPFGTTIAESVEKVFDFAADPIPVNATDLFIQLVYRGQLGEETDGIAVGTVDTQEPTIVGAWNNTDHYYSNVGFNWLIQNGSNFAHRGIDSLSICTGSPSALVYRYASPQDGLNIPFLNGTLNPGIVRLALINAKFPTPSNQQPYRMVPTLNAPPLMQLRFTQSRGQLRQASQEIFTSAMPLPAPVQCQMAEPTGMPFWCFDPIKRRRGQPIGDALQPMYFATGGGSDATDVDLPPALPVYSGLRPVVGGTVHFNTDAILMACPAQ